MKNVQFTGVFPALVTPLTAQEQLHEETARKLLRFHLRYGVDGFYLCGATGEGPVLPPQTRMALAEVAREETRGKARIIVHVGAVDLRTAVRRSTAPTCTIMRAFPRVSSRATSASAMRVCGGSTGPSPVAPHR